MKYLLYMLVVANLVYFSWQTLRGMPDEGSAYELVQLPPHARRLMTLEELRDQGIQPEFAGETVTQPGDRSESTAGTAPVAGIPALIDLPPPSAGMPLGCYSIGPFIAESELEAVSRRLEELEIQASRRSETRQVQIGYWIYLPAMPREEALSYKAKLEKHRDKEYFIGKDNVLSLGAFKEKSRAHRRLRQLRKIGIEALLEPRYRTRDVLWLELIEGISETGHDRLAAELSGVELQPQACKSIAAGKVIQ